MVRPDEAGIGAVPAEAGEGGLASAAAGVGPGAQHVRGDDRADAALVEQVGSPVAHDRQDLSFVLGGFAGEVGTASSDGSQCSRGDTALEIPALSLIRSLLAVVTIARCGHAGEPVTEVIGRGHDQRLELTLGVAGGFDSHRPDGDQHRQRSTLPATAGLAEVLAGESFASGAHGIERIGLGALPTRGPLRPIELDHHFTSFGQVPCETGAVAAGALDGPHSQCRVLVGQGDQLGVASLVRRLGAVVEFGAGRCSHDRGGVGVLVGVDADDDIDELLTTWSLRFSLSGRDVRFRSGSEVGRTVMGHARCNLAVKLLIRPVLRAGPAPGDDERTSQQQDTPQRSVKRRVTFASPSTAAQHNFGSAAHRILTVKTLGGISVAVVLVAAAEWRAGRPLTAWYATRVRRTALALVTPVK